jgi:hypothetical protein
MAMTQPSRLSEAMDLVKKELRIYSSFQTASGPQLSASTRYAPTQLRAFLEAKYAHQKQSQSPAHVQQAWSEPAEEEEMDPQDLEPVRTYEHSHGQFLQTEDFDGQSAMPEEEDKETDALKFMLHSQIKSQNFLEQEVERLTVELNDKTRESRTPVRLAPSPSPTKSRAQKIPNARTMPAEVKKEAFKKPVMSKPPGEI